MGNAWYPRFRRAMLLAHRWIGLAAAAYVLAVCATGSLLVFRDELDAALSPDVFRPPVVEGAPAATLDELIRAASTSAEGMRVNRVKFATATIGAVEVRLHGDGGHEAVAYLHPQSAAVLDVRGERDSVLNWAFDLHVTLLMGHRGETLSGWLAMAGCLLLASGVVLWVPRSVRQLPARLRVAWRAPLGRLVYDVHSVASAYASPVLLVVFVTGVLIVFHGPASRVVEWWTGQPAWPPAVRAEGEGPARPAQELLRAADRAAQALLPGARPMYAFPPRAEGGVFRTLHGVPSGDDTRTHVQVSTDPVTGAVLRVDDVRPTTWLGWLYDQVSPLHYGRWGGLFSRVLTSAAGAVGCTAVLSGAYLWWRRRASRKRLLTAPARTAAPPAAEAATGLP